MNGVRPHRETQCEPAEEFTRQPSSRVVPPLPTLYEHRFDLLQQPSGIAGKLGFCFSRNGIHHVMRTGVPTVT